jgi:hypothetical protein
LGFSAAFEERRELASEHVEGLRPRDVTGDEEGEGAGIVHGVHLAGVGVGEDGELAGERIEELRPREVAGEAETRRGKSRN